MSKKLGAHKHLPAAGVKFSAWACQPKQARLDSIVRDRRQATCKECLDVPIVCGPLTRPVQHAR